MNFCSSVCGRGLIVLLLLVLFVFSCKHRSADEFITIKDPAIALTHVRVIDGTGTAAQDDQTIIIEAGRISAIGPTSGTPIPQSATIRDLSGNPSTNIADIRKVELVFKDGVGYDSAKLIESVRGMVGTN
jgi:hypothetical protein